MDTKLPYWGSVILGTVAVILVVVNISMANTNHTAQADVQQRQAVINSAQTFGQLNQFIAQGLAESAKKGNSAARELLASQGLRLKDDAAAKAPEATPAKKK